MVVHVNKVYESVTGWQGWDEAEAAADAPLVAEGFQAAAAAPATCPPGATNGFPVSLGFEPNEQLYDQVLDDILIDIQYGRAAVPPSWSTAIEGALKVEFGGTNETTLLYKSQRHKYTLNMIQIARATHNSWLLKNRAENTEDIIFYFERTGEGTPTEYIFIVIPIIKSSAYTAPIPFLQALHNSSMQGPFSIRDCFPAKDTLFLRYSTCLTASSGGTKTGDVFVSSVGLPVNTATMQSIWAAAKSIRGTLQENRFPVVAPPTNLLSSLIFNTTTSTFSSDASMDTAFTKKVTSSRDVVEVTANIPRTSSQLIRADQTGSYKCLPFNPDNEVKDGNIKVDLDSGLVVNDVGEPLSDVLEARAKVIAGAKGRLEEAPGNWEKWLTTGFAVLFFLIAGALLIWLSYTIYKSMTGAPAAAPTSVPTAEGLSGV